LGAVLYRVDNQRFIMQAALATDPSPSTPVKQTLWVSADHMDQASKDALMEKVGSIPRPPRAMEQLLSQEFINKATSVELSNLVKSEPAVTAKLIATVNSPLYNLRNPVQNIGQAITFLGVNQVRGLCLQLMLADCFASKDVRVGKALDAVWQSNRAAGALLPKLTSAYKLDDPASLTSKVILSFVGQLAMVGLMPASSLATWSRLGRVLRCRMEQGFVKINATELGALVLKSWQLHDALVRDVVDIDRVLVDPLEDSAAESPSTSAVGFLCVWMAEQLARGQGSASAPTWSPIDKDTAELQAWLSYSELPGMPEGTATLHEAPMQTIYAQIRSGSAG
jgi:HD-like signal output (HDOD) protein